MTWKPRNRVSIKPRAIHTTIAAMFWQRLLGAAPPPAVPNRPAATTLMVDYTQRDPKPVAVRASKRSHT